MNIKENKPLIFTEGKHSQKDILTFKKKNKIWRFLDLYSNQSTELFAIRNPNLTIGSLEFKHQFKTFASKRFVNAESIVGSWIYFPWNGYLLHTLTRTEYFELRTNRNQNLITKNEQKKLYETSIGVVGLSIGESIATTLTYQGIGKHLVLAEFDSLETTNLNRIRASLIQVGSKKIDIVSQKIYDINPFADLTLFDKGLSDINVKSFFEVAKPKIIFEAIDDLRMKIILRKAAHKYGVPLVMLTNIGDRVMIDVERHDKDKDIKIFNGLDEGILSKIIKKQIEKEELNKFVVSIVGINNISMKTLDSVKEVGLTLRGRPQLVGTVTISGGFASYIARQIILYNQIESGRYLLPFNHVFNIAEK